MNRSKRKSTLFNLDQTLFSRRYGFTLIEVLVVVAIITLLTGMALVGVSIARRRGQVMRVKSDLAMIGIALEAYRTDFGDYPRFALPADDQSTNNDGWLDYSSDRGARLLCQALIAPGPETGQSSPDGQDGCDGPGFRIRRNILDPAGHLGGKVYGPYLASDKFKLEWSNNNPNMQDAKILDIFGHAILYYPALPGVPKIAPPHGLFVFLVDPSVSNPLTPMNVKAPLYNAYDNTADTTTGLSFLSEHELAYMLGDTQFDGTLEPPEYPTTTQKYLLWTAGPDGNFGRGPDGKTDDIANFDFPTKIVR